MWRRSEGFKLNLNSWNNYNIEVLKTSSPTDGFVAPNPVPSITVPSSKTKMAGNDIRNFPQMG